MRQIIFIIAVLWSVLPIFAQRTNSNGEKLVKKVTVYHNNSKITSKCTYDYDNDGNMVSMYRKRYRDGYTCGFKLSYINGKFYGGIYDNDVKVDYVTCEYKNTGNRIDKEICYTIAPTGDKYINAIDFTYLNNRLHKALFINKCCDKGKQEYLYTDDLNEYTFTYKNNRINLFLELKRFRNFKQDLSNSCSSFLEINDTNINLLQFLDYVGNIKDCDILYSGWVNCKSDLLPHKVCGYEVKYVFDDNDNIIEMYKGRYKYVIEYCY